MYSFWSSIDAASIDQITDKIYLGNESGAYNKKMLQDRGITHILVCGNYLQKKFPNDFTYLQLPLNDFVSQDLFPYFHEAFEFIDKAEKVYVHCAAGVSRSSSMVIGYLMYTKGWKYLEAYEYVKKRRSIICPNPGFSSQLKKLEGLIQKGETDLKKYTKAHSMY